MSASLLRLARHLAPPRVIYDRDGYTPYLSRYYLVGAPHMPDGSPAFEADGGPRPGAIWPDRRFGVYLHRFHRSDEADELHNHPWSWAVSLILSGSYSEERLQPDGSIGRRVFGPGSVNRITHDTFHRVDLLTQECWTLFIVGRKERSWGFWDRETDEFVPWREYIARRRSGL